MMKHLNVRHSQLALCALGLALFAISCDKEEEEEDNEYTLSGNGNGAQEAPNPVTTNGTGSLSGNYDSETNVINYTVNWSNLSSNVTNGHFHGPADPGQAAGPVLGFTITNTATTGSVTGTATLTEEQEAQLLGGKWYWNIHTANFGGGEVRGQVSATR